MSKFRTAQESRRSGAVEEGGHGVPGIHVGGQFIPRTRIAAASRQASMGPMGGGNANISGSGFTNVYDPIISRDFLELPQDLNVRWAWYRHFYRHNPLVNRAIDLHSTLPISRVTLKPPKGQDRARNLFVKDFFERMVSRIGLLIHLISATREYNLVGNYFAYAQDDEDTLEGNDPFEDYPEDDFKHILDPKTNKKRATSDEERLRLKRQWYGERFGKRNPKYRGWEKIILLPVENIRVQSFEFDPDIHYQYVPGNTGHPYINRPYTVMDTRNYLLNPLRRTVPHELFDLYEQMEQYGQPLDLPTDPYTGSAVCHVARNAADFDELGISALDPVLLDLIHKDKLRQTNTLIVNRRMTPIRLIWAEDLSLRDLEGLRMQIDAAMHTPDFSVVTNYQVNWEEVGGQDRLIDTGTLNQDLDRDIMIGLKTNEGLVTGDNTYGGNRITAEMMNVEYLQYRETVLEWYIEEFLFKPVAYKKGFVEIDDFGNEVLLYPSVRFARLGIRDNDQLYDQMFNLYLKGSLPLSVILDLINIDIDEAEEGIKEDMMTVRDAKFNDMWGRVLDEAAARLIDTTDIVDRLIEYLEVGKVEGGGEEEEGGGAPGGFGRFGSLQFQRIERLRDLSNSKELDPEARSAIAAIVERSIRSGSDAPKRPAYGRYGPGGEGNLLEKHQKSVGADLEPSR